MDVEITKTPDHGECIRCGKGINVSCVLGQLGFKSVALGFVAGRSEKQ